MTCQDVIERLDAYHLGTLTRPEMEALEQHLLACRECGAEFRFQRSLRTEVAALPRSIAPGRELWSGIEGRIGGKEVLRTAQGSARRRPWLLAAAAIGLIVASSATTAVLVRRSNPGKAVPGVSVTLTEAAYRQAADELLNTLESRRAKMSPKTLDVVERNPRIIDEAIRETQTALASDPGNRAVTDLLWASYQKKIDLLQRVASDVQS